MGGERDSINTKIVKGAVTAAGLAGLGWAAVRSGEIKATETAEPGKTSQPGVTETVVPPSYEVTVESITGEKISLATPESLGMAPIEEEMTPIERLLSDEVLAKLARENNPLLYRMVDSKHPLSEEFVEVEIVPNLVDLPELPTINDTEQVNSLVKADLIELFEQAKLEGENIYVRSGYRSFWQQQYALDKVGGDTSLVESPWASHHQTGLAVDFQTPENGGVIGLGSGFENTEAGKWLMENAWEYGFVESYINGHDGVNPLAEPHHYLYVGKEIASVLHQLKLLGWPGDIFDLQEVISQSADGGLVGN